jgi:hypothetical protein
MSVPEHMEVAYECRNGHVNTDHAITFDDSFRDGKRPACKDCSARLTRKLVPFRECENCGNIWAYTGDADRPTCPNCAGKKTTQVG